MLMIWLLLLAAAIAMAIGLFSPRFEMRMKSLLIAAICVGAIAGILYVTQWSHTAVALY